MLVAIPDFTIAVNVLYGFVNAAIMLLIGVTVYNRDAESIVNRGFALSAGIAALGFTSVSIGVLVWTTPIIGEPGIVTLNRVSYLCVTLAVLFLSWSSRVLYEGQALWKRSRNVLFFGILIAFNVFAVLTPDASYIIQDDPNGHTGEGFVFSLIAYPSIALLACMALYSFIMTYRDAKDEDLLIEKQALRFIIASLLMIVGLLVAFFITTRFIEMSARYISYSFVTLGVIIMASGFSQEASLVKVKIMNELRRMSRSMTKGNTKNIEDYMDYLTALVEKEGSDTSITRMKILEGLMAIYRVNLMNAQQSLEHARILARQQGLEDQVGIIDSYLDHLRIHTPKSMILESEVTAGPAGDRKEDLLAALAYLDEIIELRVNEELCMESSSER